MVFQVCDMNATSRTLPAVLLAVVAVALVASGIGPHDRQIAAVDPAVADKVRPRA